MNKCTPSNGEGHTHTLPIIGQDLSESYRVQQKSNHQIDRQIFYNKLQSIIILKIQLNSGRLPEGILRQSWSPEYITHIYELYRQTGDRQPQDFLQMSQKRLRILTGISHFYLAFQFSFTKQNLIDFNNWKLIDRLQLTPFQYDHLAIFENSKMFAIKTYIMSKQQSTMLMLMISSVT